MCICVIYREALKRFSLSVCNVERWVIYDDSFMIVNIPANQIYVQISTICVISPSYNVLHMSGSGRW